MSESSLFAEFPGQSEAEWKAKIIKDLRGKAFEEIIRESPDGIDIQPIYTADSAAVQHQALKEHPKWDNVLEILVLDAKEANAEALKYLNRGATSLLFYLPGKVDLMVLLEGIQLEYICCNLVIEGHVEYYNETFGDLLNQRGLDEAELEGSINFDPIENLARTGDWFESEAADFSNLKALQAGNYQGFRSIALNTNLFANAGATLAQQLGIALAMAYEYQHRLGITSSRAYWVNFAVGSDYFGEMAKLRAFRRIWGQWQRELGWEEREVRIYAETSLRNKSILDKHNNLIRTTAEAMSAIIGGATEVCVKGFAEPLEDQGFFPRRLALNQLSILQHESRLDQVRDMAAGNYWVEHLTESLATKAWGFFQEIEEEGGIIAALKKDWLQDQISIKAEAEQGRFDSGEMKMIGVNIFRNKEESFDPSIVQSLKRASSSKETLIRPLKVRRLAAKLETEVLFEKAES